MFQLQVVGFVLLTALAHASVLQAQEVRTLSDLGLIPQGSGVDVRNLPPQASTPPPGRAVAQEKKPLLVPDPSRLRRLKGLLRIPGYLPATPNLVEDTGAGAPPSVSAPATSTQFEGLNQLDNASQIGYGVLPSDSNLSVGPTEIFQMVNLVGRITDKLGSPASASTFPLDFFFGVDFFSQGTDPRIMYDALSGRWFAAYLQFSTIFNSSAIIIAVSTTSSPTLFCKYQIQSNILQDFPTLGLSNDKVIVGYDGYQWDFATFVGTGYYVFDKAALVNCAQSVAAAQSLPDPARNTIQAAQSLTSTNDLYMATHDWLSGSALTVLKVSGVPGQQTPVTETATSVPITAWLAPPGALQRAENGGASSQLLATNDARVVSAAWQNQSLWVAGTEACTPAGDSLARSCVRLIEVPTNTMTIRQDMTYGAVGQYYYYPAVRPDSLGSLYVVFTASSADTFAGVRTTGRLADDPVNTLQASSLLRAGEGEQTHSSGRMGDYSGAAVDPSAPHTVWVMAEYIMTRDPFLTDGVADWGTYVAQLSFSSGPSLPTVSIGDATVTEGNSGTINAVFTVNLSAASSQTVTVGYATADGTATAGSPDYQAASGTVTFAPGETSQLVSVVVNGDTVNEPNETFVVNLSGATNATLGDSQGVGTILNDDPPPASITVVTPNGGNTWRINQKKTIQWTSSGITSNVRVQLTRDNGNSWGDLFSPSTPNDGAQSWKVTGPATTQARVRVCNLDLTVCDESDGNFTIK